MSKMEGQWYSDEHMNRVMKKLYDYERRIKKAIEYIINETTYSDCDEMDKLLDILRGEDNE